MKKKNHLLGLSLWTASMCEIKLFNWATGCCSMDIEFSVVKDFAAMPSAESGESSQNTPLFSSQNLAGLWCCVNTPFQLQSIFSDNINHIQTIS